MYDNVCINSNDINDNYMFTISIVNYDFTINVVSISVFVCVQCAVIAYTYIWDRLCKGGAR